jgi:hypothetical protein
VVSPSHSALPDCYCNPSYLLLCVALRWEDYLQKNLTFAETNNGEYVCEPDATSFLNILDILSSQLTFRYAGVWRCALVVTEWVRKECIHSAAWCAKPLSI